MGQTPEELWKELEVARKELLLLRTENYDLKKKVADFESIVGDKGRVQQCEVYSIAETQYCTALLHD